LAENAGLPALVNHSEPGDYTSLQFPPWIGVELGTIHTDMRVNMRNVAGIFAFHSGGAYVAMADGSVHFLQETISPQVLSALLTREGDDVVRDKDWQR
jgi:prepilin-type processing-associated H-X9-DG protein